MHGHDDARALGTPGIDVQVVDEQGEQLNYDRQHDKQAEPRATVVSAPERVLGPTFRAVLEQVGLAAVCLYVAMVAATFVFFYPVLTGQSLSHPEWLMRMWFPSWF